MRIQNENTKKKQAFEPKGFSGTVFTLAHDLVYVLAAITVVFVFVVRLTGVFGSSMYPTLVGQSEASGTKGDYLALLSNVLCAEYHPGDIVVACVPSFEEGKPIVKRVIAEAGQTVDLRYDEDGVYRVYVDDVAQDEPYINGQMYLTLYKTIDFPTVVPENCYFLMGDNRNNSNDSRNPQIGMVNRQYIVGKALTILFPGQENYSGARDWSRFGTLGGK